MSFLYRALPTEITVGGRKYPIRTEASVWMQVDDLMADGSVPFPEKAARMIALTFSGRELPGRLSELLSALYDFYNCGKPQVREKNVPAKKRILSFEADCPLIYAAFLSCYGVDLSKEDPHWFLFCAMLEGLEQNTKLSEVLGIRATNPADIRDKNVRSRLMTLKQKYRLPDLRSDAQIEQDTAAEFDAMM